MKLTVILPQEFMHGPLSLDVAPNSTTLYQAMDDFIRLHDISFTEFCIEDKYGKEKDPNVTIKQANIYPGSELYLKRRPDIPKGAVLVKSLDVHKLAKQEAQRTTDFVPVRFNLTCIGRGIHQVNCNVYDTLDDTIHSAPELSDVDCTQLAFTHNNKRYENVSECSLMSLCIMQPTCIHFTRRDESLFSGLMNKLRGGARLFGKESRSFANGTLQPQPAEAPSSAKEPQHAENIDDVDAPAPLEPAPLDALAIEDAIKGPEEPLTSKIDEPGATMPSKPEPSTVLAPLDEDPEFTPELYYYMKAQEREWEERTGVKALLTREAKKKLAEDRQCEQKTLRFKISFSAARINGIFVLSVPSYATSSTVYKLVDKELMRRFSSKKSPLDETQSADAALFDDNEFAELLNGAYYLNLGILEVKRLPRGDSDLWALVNECSAVLDIRLEDECSEPLRKLLARILAK